MFLEILQCVVYKNCLPQLGLRINNFWQFRHRYFSNVKFVISDFELRKRKAETQCWTFTKNLLHFRPHHFRRNPRKHETLVLWSVFLCWKSDQYILHYCYDYLCCWVVIVNSYERDSAAADRMLCRDIIKLYQWVQWSDAAALACLPYCPLLHLYPTVFIPCHITHHSINHPTHQPFSSQITFRHKIGDLF